MAVVIRNGRSYLYRSVRKGGKVTSEYAGSGEVASLAGRLETIEREERRLQLAEERKQCDRLDAQDRPVAELSRLVEIIARATLEAAGYHLHRRNEWRKRRPMSTDPKKVPPADSSNEILQRAQKGDRSALPIVREWLAQRPGALSDVLDVATLAEEALVEPLCGENLLYREVMIRDLHALTDKLAGPDPSPVEHLLARRAAACWYAVNIYEKEYAQSGGVTLKMGTYLQERIDRCHRRLTTSLKTLATVRRLTRGGPLVAVNVEQSVTVEAPAVAAEKETSPGVAELLASRGTGRN